MDAQIANPERPTRGGKWESPLHSGQAPGASLIHSAGLAAHVPTVAAIEANARQYVPAANKPWEAKFPGTFHIKDGMMRTGEIRGPGLGAV
jgi:hypothetical protein